MTFSPPRSHPILVVDDDRSTVMLIRRYLQKVNYPIVTASNGQQAWEMIQADPPDVIISDWSMPGLTGIELCTRVKTHFHLCYFILLTSQGQTEKKVHALDAGADEFLTKPIDQEELLARVRVGLRLMQLSRDLQTQNQLLENELAAAAQYVRSQLPPPLQQTIQTNWRFKPCRQLGGDCFDYFWLDSEHFLIYLLDVSGHGVGAALLSVAVLQLLRSGGLAVDFRDPNQTLTALNKTFDMSDHNDLYFTIWYGVYNPVRQELVYAGGGHPPAILVTDNHIQSLASDGFPIGMIPGAVFPHQCQAILPGSTLYLFSDGAYEITKPDGKPWSWDAFLENLTQSDHLDSFIATVQGLSAQDSLEDDLCLLQVRF
jgi:phosphoserine phosphatase RsbU/P